VNQVGVVNDVMGIDLMGQSRHTGFDTNSDSRMPVAFNSCGWFRYKTSMDGLYGSYVVS
jgi:hypothetical protein